MRTCWVSIVFLSVLVCMAGCGGSGGGQGSSGPSSYAGTYGGVFNDTSGIVAPFSMTVLSNGSITGQYSYSTGAKKFTGYMNNSGVGVINTASGSAQMNVGTPQPTLGGGIFNSNGVGAFFTAVTNPSGVFGGANPFSGAYAGTVHDTTLNHTGIIAMAIDPVGNILGTDLVTLNGIPTLAFITGTVTANGSMVYGYSSTGANPVTVVINGTATISNGTITAPLNSSTGDSVTLSISEVQ